MHSPPPTFKHLLYISRQISTPSQLSQLLSLSITLNLLHLHLPSLNSLLHSLPPPLSFTLFSSLLKLSLKPDSFTLTSALKATSSLSLLPHGLQLHSLSLKLALDRDTFVLNSLLHMYSQCTSIQSSRKLFDYADTSLLDVVSWNTLMSGYLKSGLCGDALWVFAEMLRRGVGMDGMSPVSASIACGRMGWVGLGRRVHGVVVVSGFELDFYLGSSLVSMYAKCGDFEGARKVFDGIGEKNVVIWTSMISGCSQGRRFREAIGLFREMQVGGVRPDKSTVACVVSCCGQLGALDQGRYVHAYCDANGLGNDIVVKNALIDMYSKCGDIERALRIFRGLIHPDVFSWTAMISGLAMNGHFHKALEMFSQMEEQGKAVPNEVTFLGVLSACSHGGLVDKGLYYLRRMSEVYQLPPKIEHYGCIVDLLGRAKLLKEAERFIGNMPIEPDVVIWRSLLFACRAHEHEDVELAEFAAKRIIELEPSKCGGHVLLSNVYAVASKWSDVNQVRKVMNEQSIQKQPGCSFIEVNGSVHEFLVADLSHHRTEEIYDALWGISRMVLSEAYTTSTSGFFNYQLGDVTNENTF